MVLLPTTVPQPSQYKGPKPLSLPVASSEIGSLGGELDGGEAAVLALHAGDEALADGETEEDRTGEQGYRRGREPARQCSSLGSPARFRRPGSTSRPW